MENNINVLFDRVIRNKPLKNDAALARLLNVAPPVVSKMRRFRLDVGPSMILSLVELGGLSLDEIRAEIPRKPLDAGNRE